MRSGPHHRNMGCREASRRFTVVSKVSDQVSTGPTGVLSQAKLRMSSAISPWAMIREGDFVGRGGIAALWGLERRDDDGFVKPGMDFGWCGVSLSEPG